MSFFSQISSLPLFLIHPCPTLAALRVKSPRRVLSSHLSSSRPPTHSNYDPIRFHLNQNVTNALTACLLAMSACVYFDSGRYPPELVLKGTSHNNKPSAPPNKPVALVAEMWGLTSDSDPTLQSTQTHFVKRLGISTPSVSNLSGDGRYIRVEDTFFREDSAGDYVVCNPLPQTVQKQYTERVGSLTVAHDIVAVTNRKTYVPSADAVEPKDEFEFAEPFHSDDSDDEEESDASSVDSDDEAYESWSECSVDVSVMDYESDNDSIKEADDEGLGEDDEDEEEDEEDEEDNDEEESNESSDQEDASDDDSSDEEEDKPEDTLHPTRASIAIFDSTGRIFHYSKKVVAPMFESPPILHPTKPLVVWPLGESEVFFGDYIGKTFYTRSAWTLGFASTSPFLPHNFLTRY